MRWFYRWFSWKICRHSQCSSVWRGTWRKAATTIVILQFDVIQIINVMNIGRRDIIGVELFAIIKLPLRSAVVVRRCAIDVASIPCPAFKTGWLAVLVAVDFLAQPRHQFATVVVSPLWYVVGILVPALGKSVKRTIFAIDANRHDHQVTGYEFEIREARDNADSGNVAKWIT